MPQQRWELVSEAANLAYPIRDGIPVMLVDEAQAKEIRDSRLMLAGSVVARRLVGQVDWLMVATAGGDAAHGSAKRRRARTA